jgi:predicted phage terminase large subunit-like protein
VTAPFDPHKILSQFKPEEWDRIRREALKELAQRSLLKFVEQHWHIVEPKRKFVSGWAVEAICDHLEAVTAGHIKRLLISVSPGFTKSMTTGVFWPAWEWGPRNMPTMRYVVFSYSDALTRRDNVRFRRIIRSPAYQESWGDRVQTELADIVKVSNSQTGWKLATSVKGLGTGERGDRIIIDDPNNVKEAESDAVREGTNTWFREALSDRLNDITESAIVLIQQRVHESDVTGTALTEEMGYEHLCIPMYYEPARHCVTSIWEDPREEEGELAWPERFPLKQLQQLEKDKGPYAWSAQYQQAPTPRGGGIIKREWWQPWPPTESGHQWIAEEEFRDFDGVMQKRKRIMFPNFEYIYLSLDSAYTEKEENDPSACTVWGIFRTPRGFPGVMLIWGWKEWLEFHALIVKIKDTCKKRGCDGVLIEAKASGLSLIQELNRGLKTGGGDFTVYPIPVTKDKVARMHSAVPSFSNGIVYAPGNDELGIPTPAWATMVIDETCSFPKGKHRDIGDSVSQAINYLRRQGLALLIPEAEEEDRRQKTFRGNHETVQESYGV